MKLVSWNVQQGGGRRLIRQMDRLAQHAPDIVALQEITSGTVSAYRRLLTDMGLRHLTDSFALAPHPECLTGPRRYGELLASRWPLHPLPPGDFPVPWPERILSATVESPVGPVEVHVTHIPPGSTNGWIKIEILEGLFSRLGCDSATPRILCGDFNTPARRSRTAGW